MSDNPSETNDISFKNEEQLQAALELFPIDNYDESMLKHFNEDVVEELYSFAYTYYEKGWYTEAESLFRILTAARMRSSRYWKGLGATLQMLKKYEQAIEAYSWAAINDEHMQDPYSHYHAAECLFSLGKLKRSLIALNSAKAVAEKSGNYKGLLSQISLLSDIWKNKAKKTKTLKK